jgi:hypothetical protein
VIVLTCGLVLVNDVLVFQVRSQSRHNPRLVAMLMAGAVAVMCLVGCGGAAGPAGNVVVRVGKNVVTRAMFSHWMRVTALRDNGSVSGEALRDQVLSSLITAEWFFAEGEARGLHVTSAEIRERVAQVMRNGFPSRAAFARYLRQGGETEADQSFRSRIKLFSAKIQAQLMDEPTADARQRALLAFVERFPERWAAKTSCRRGFVVANCREYKGAMHPEARLL